jgi:hypothetical protein
MPGFAHGKEGRVGYGLGVCSYTVVLLGREVDVCATEAGEDVFYFSEAVLGGAVFDED